MLTDKQLRYQSQLRNQMLARMRRALSPIHLSDFSPEEQEQLEDMIALGLVTRCPRNCYTAFEPKKEKPAPTANVQMSLFGKGQ